MKILRQLHLYLGCVFAPLIVFFCVSGVWQTLNIRLPDGVFSQVTHLLTTIHTGHSLKFGEPSTLSSPVLEVVVVLMALCLIATIVLGVMMAFKFGRSRVAIGCLAAGIVVPLILVLARLF